MVLPPKELWEVPAKSENSGARPLVFLAVAHNRFPEVASSASHAYCGPADPRGRFGLLAALDSKKGTGRSHNASANEAKLKEHTEPTPDQRWP